VQCPRHTPQCDLEFDDIEEAYFAFLPRDAGNTVDPALASHIEALSPNLRARIERLDKVASDGGTPVSGSYSPLTHTSVSLARDSLNLSGPPEAPPAPPANPKSQLPIVLMIAAIALVGVIAWVVFGGL
jgi:hypothetical protein